MDEPSRAMRTAADAEFLARFEDGTLPFESWTHRAHVKAAWLYLRDGSLDEAIDRMRVGIQRYNAAHDVPETPTSGYHETMTVAFMRLLHAMMQAHAKTDQATSADAFYEAHPELHAKQALRLFYSRERILDPAAKTTFVEPDLAPLPMAPSS
jgi:hypothetical protein